MASRRTFSRPPGKRPYRRLFIIAVEGRKTEQQYFQLLRNACPNIQIKIVPSNDQSAPLYVLNRMRLYLKKEGVRLGDEAWLVVDTDAWPAEQLAQLHSWSLECDSQHLATSNPKFELWLLLHFEDGAQISATNVEHRLHRHLPGYDKKIDSRKFPLEKIKQAIQRAKAKDQPRCEDWPRTAGHTTVYRLVEHLLT